MVAMPMVWRGVGYGVGLSASVWAVLGAVMAFGVLLSPDDGGALDRVGLALGVGLGLSAVGAVLGVLPGLAVGVALGVLRSGHGAQVHRRAALGGGGAFLLQSLALGAALGSYVALGLAMVGTPTAALLAAVAARAVREGRQQKERRRDTGGLAIAGQRGGG